MCVCFFWNVNIVIKVIRQIFHPVFHNIYLKLVLTCEAIIIEAIWNVSGLLSKDFNHTFALSLALFISIVMCDKFAINVRRLTNGWPRETHLHANMFINLTEFSHSQYTWIRTVHTHTHKTVGTSEFYGQYVFAHKHTFKIGPMSAIKMR